VYNESLVRCRTTKTGLSVFASATELIAAYQRGETTPTDVVEKSLQQIERYNPGVNAVITLDAEGARARARAATSALARGESWGALHGVPITIKDVFETAGLRTTAGSQHLAEHVPHHDATIVARLRQAGAIIVGKTNTPEFADDAQTTNEIFGTTCNPWNPSRTAGGSSGGAAAAVASGFCALDVGSDIGGSLRLPAHDCGVFAIKTTDHLIPWTGHVPPPPETGWGLMRDLLSMGPLARSIDDLELAVRVLAGPDEIDVDTPPVATPSKNDRRLFEMRIAWSTDFDVDVDDDTANALDVLVRRLAARGCRVEQQAPRGFDASVASMVREELQTAAIQAGAHRPPGTRAALRVLADYWPGVSPPVRGYLRGAGADLAHHASALDARAHCIRTLESFLHEYDAWLVPVAPTPAFAHVDTTSIVRRARATLPVRGARVPYAQATCAFTAPFNTTGSPVVVLPIGRSRDGLPIGVQLVGRRWHDIELLGVARAIVREITGPFQVPPRVAAL